MASSANPAVANEDFVAGEIDILNPQAQTLWICPGSPFGSSGSRPLYTQLPPWCRRWCSGDRVAASRFHATIHPGTRRGRPARVRPCPLCRSRGRWGARLRRAVCPTAWRSAAALFLGGRLQRRVRRPPKGVAPAGPRGRGRRPAASRRAPGPLCRHRSQRRQRQEQRPARTPSTPGTSRRSGNPAAGR